MLKQVLRSLVLRLGRYLDLVEVRDDPRYQRSHIGADVYLGGAVLEGENSIGRNSELHGNVKIGFRTTLGHNCILYGDDVSIGRYCQLAPHVALYAVNHPLDYLTTYVNKRLFDKELKRHNISSWIQIGNDVWMGHGAFVLSGVKIGNGAVVGAGAVVTKDVPDFGVVVGNPAKLIKYRFDNEIIGILNLLAWWDKSPEQLERMKPLFFMNFREDHEFAVQNLKKYIDMFSDYKNDSA